MVVAKARAPIDEDLCDAVWAVVLEARDRFVERLEDGVHLPRDFEPPEFGTFDKSGFPHLTRGFSSEQVDFRRCFGLGGQDKSIPFKEFESYQHLTELIEAHERLLKSFLVKEPPKQGHRFRDFFDLEVWEIPVSIFDRLMRQRGKTFSKEDFLGVYCEIEAGYLWDRLPIVIVVPIALTHFESSAFQISSATGIIELSKETQLARIPSRYSPATSANELVVGAATHAFVLTNYEMDNPSGNPYPEHDNLGWYPTALIDRFFDALRVATGIDTGYAQLFLSPRRGWATSFSRDLPPIIRGPAVRRYPPHFDQFGWLDERDAVTDEQLAKVGEVFAALSGNDSLQLAASRLSAAMLRENDDDKILDLLIGLEAALGDESKMEMAYKLAMRTAAILAEAGVDDAGVVFGNVKRLYDYRSAVAHGDKKRAAKRREIELGGKSLAASDLAAEYLRKVISERGSRSDIQNGSDVDSKLVLKVLTQAALQADTPGQEPQVPSL